MLSWIAILPIPALQSDNVRASLFRVNKRAIVAKIVASLAAELNSYAQSARAAHSDATDEQSKAENKYDTRGLESSYLARGQSRQAAETETARQLFESLVLREFGPETPIDIGALVEVEAKSGSAQDDEARSIYFIGPKAGGTEVVHAKKRILVITPESPLGREIVGKCQGMTLKVSIGGATWRFTVNAVW